MNHEKTTRIDEPVEQRLIELEIKASFTEDWLEQLNQTIFKQQEQIEALMRELSQLRRQMPEGDGASLLRDELPPHY